MIATPLTFFPRVLNLVFGSLLTEMNKPDTLEGTAETTIRTLNVLEKNLAHFAGLACFTLAILIVVQVRDNYPSSTLLRAEFFRIRELTRVPFLQSGALPLTSSLSASQGVAQSSAAAPFRQPTIFMTTAFFSILAWNTYDLNMRVAAAPSAGLALFGVWVVSLSLSETCEENLRKDPDFRSFICVAPLRSPRTSQPS